MNLFLSFSKKVHFFYFVIDRYNEVSHLFITFKIFLKIINLKFIHIKLYIK